MLRYVLRSWWRRLTRLESNGNKHRMQVRWNTLGNDPVRPVKLVLQERHS